MLASKYGHLDVVEYLVGEGANMRMSDRNGRTALALAVESSVHECSASAFIQKTVEDFQKALEGSVQEAVEGKLSLIIESGASSVGGNMEIVKFLINSGAIVDKVDDEGHSVLSAASYGGDFDLVKYLLGAGARVNDGNALFGASLGGYSDIVQYLLEAGADVDSPNDGRTALHVTSQNGHSDIVKLLLEAGADVNLQGTDGRTALYTAVSNSQLDTAKLLLEAGADVNLRDNDGRQFRDDFLRGRFVCDKPVREAVEQAIIQVEEKVSKRVY